MTEKRTSIFENGLIWFGAGVSLGVTFVFFAGILAGHLGLSVDPQMLNYAESFGLVIFVYSLGLQVGPGFLALSVKVG